MENPTSSDRSSDVPPSGVGAPPDHSTAPPPQPAEGSHLFKKEVGPQPRRSFLGYLVQAGAVGGLGGLTGWGISRWKKRREPETRSKQPLGAEFTYDVSRFQKTDPALLRYQEESRFACGLSRPRALATAGGMVYIGGDEGIRKTSESGELLANFKTEQPVHAIALRPNGELLVGEPGAIRVLDAAGSELACWNHLGEKLVPTAIAVTGDAVYVADAGTRVVLKLDPEGKKLIAIGARDPQRDLSGFVVPSPYFCVRMAPDGLLRISNPGEHLIEAFTTDGDREIAWGRGSFAVEGFCGCCNPVSFEVMPDGSFITCEKGLPRVKLYDAHGEFAGLVAGPEAFPEYLKTANIGSLDTHHAGLYAALGSNGRVLVLDAVSGTLRVMKPKSQEDQS